MQIIKTLLVISLFSFQTAHSSPLLTHHVKSLCSAHYNISDIQGAQKWCSIAAQRGDLDSKIYFNQLNLIADAAADQNETYSIEKLSKVCIAHFDINDIDGILKWCDMAARQGDKYSAQLLKAIKPQQESTDSLTKQ